MLHTFFFFGPSSLPYSNLLRESKKKKTAKYNKNFFFFFSLIQNLPLYHVWGVRVRVLCVVYTRMFMHFFEFNRKRRRRKKWIKMQIIVFFRSFCNELTKYTTRETIYAVSMEKEYQVENWEFFFLLKIHETSSQSTRRREKKNWAWTKLKEHFILYVNSFAFCVICTVQHSTL